jgi:hypothetical protein
VSISIVKYSETLSNRVSIVIRYMDQMELAAFITVSFIILFS